MALEIQVKESTEQLVFGIPLYLSLSTNEPANIFYTLDGTDPNQFSLMAEDKVYLPTNQGTVIFKAIAYSGSESSSIITEEYNVDFNKLKLSRKGETEGIHVIEEGKDIVFSLSQNLEGDPTQSSTHKFEDLDIKASTTDSEGVKTKGGTSLDLINFAKTVLVTDKFTRSSPNNDNVYFDPKAKVILLDGSTEEALNNQSVRLINRPYGTMSPASKFYTENENYERNIITGNLVNYVYNNATGEIIFYYYESKESRWIVSKQKTDAKELNFGKTYISARISKYVFQWIKDPVMSKLR
ncbi:chitobiase/beta-hexosaminidase C-terminal domain-containing protein [bacterium]|nr:chitobiase/beta-hexosaminidase C-terminal domain-containing protein [bacterium]